MRLSKKSLGQNFLIEKNIAKKILNLTSLKGKNLVEIGPGNGFLTDQIVEKKPKSLILIEKDNFLFKNLKLKYRSLKFIEIINADVLKIDFNKVIKKNSIIVGNLPYNISSQILTKIICNQQIDKKYSDLIFMFQRELGERIIAKFPSKNYGRLAILSRYKLKILNKFLVSPNCFKPKPKVTSMVIHFKYEKNEHFKIKKTSNLELVTNILFSNRRKMINKSIKNLLNEQQLKLIQNLNFSLRPEEISPDIFYKITELFEKK